jgi:hypothetical protein
VNLLAFGGTIAVDSMDEDPPEGPATDRLELAAEVARYHLAGIEITPWSASVTWRLTLAGPAGHDEAYWCPYCTSDF